MTKNLFLKGGFIMDLKTYDKIGRTIRELQSNVRIIERYRKENEEYLAELSNLLGRPVTLEEVLNSREDDN